MTGSAHCEVCICGRFSPLWVLHLWPVLRIVRCLSVAESKSSVAVIADRGNAWCERLCFLSFRTNLTQACSVTVTSISLVIVCALSKYIEYDLIQSVALFPLSPKA